MGQRLFVIVLALICNTVPSIGQSVPSIQGVWRIVEQTINERTLSGPTLGVGFHVYTARHYAVIRETGQPPRTVISDTTNATAAQLLGAWGPFVAQFGTYELTGNRMTETVLVAKEPAVSGRSSVRRFKLDGDTLITEPIERTPGARYIALKLVRVE